MPKVTSEVHLFLKDTDMVGESGMLKRIHNDKEVFTKDEARKLVAEEGPFNVDVIMLRTMGKPLHRAEQTVMGWKESE